MKYGHVVDSADRSDSVSRRADSPVFKFNGLRNKKGELTVHMFLNPFERFSVEQHLRTTIGELDGDYSIMKISEDSILHSKLGMIQD